MTLEPSTDITCKHEAAKVQDADGSMEGVADGGAGGLVVEEEVPDDGNDAEEKAPKVESGSPISKAAAQKAEVAASLSPSLLTSIRASDIDKRVNVVGSMIPKRLRHSDQNNLISIFSFETTLSQLLTCDSADSMLRIQEQLVDGKKALMAFVDVMKASARSLKNAVANFKRHSDGAQSRAEAAALAKEQSLQQEAAERAKAELDKRSKEIQPTYKLHGIFPSVKSTKEGFASDWDPAVPCLFEAEGVTQLEELKKDPASQLMFASFGGSFKKTQQFQNTKMY